MWVGAPDNFITKNVQICVFLYILWTNFAESSLFCVLFVHRLEKKYTTAGSGGSDKYQICDMLNVFQKFKDKSGEINFLLKTAQIE